MAENNDRLVLGTKTAGADFSARASQYLLMKSTTSGTFAKQVSVGGRVVGVLLDRPASGQPGALCVLGVCKVRVNSTAHAAIAVGDKLCASTAAGAIPSTLITRYSFGIALETLSSNSAANTIITCLVNHSGAGSSGTAAGA